MIMKKSYLFPTALALLLLASCSSDEFVGENNPQGSNGSGGAISFSTGTPMMTRTDKTGSAAATDLNNNFVVFGYKTMSDNSQQTVFSNYQANYVTSTANTTESNSADWEYVGYKNLPGAMTGYTGVAGNTTSGLDQTIKYWDYSASNYKFYAYSLGAGKTSGAPATTTYANGSIMSTGNTYTLEGDQDQLAACYISELKTIEDPSGSTPTEVDLRFLSIKSKIQLGFYETIPGYSVKLLKFYDSSSDDASDAIPVLFAGTSILPKAGTYTITFDSNGKPLLAWAAAASDGTQANVSFSSTLTNYAAKEYQEEAADNTYLGRASNEATMTEVKDVLPYANGAELTLKVDYTLISRDGTGETIEVKGATAKVPAAFTQWKPNYKYTYLFKISDNTNGQVGEVTGLYPITLDAVVASEQDGSQETITTVSEPSITTYAKASAVTSDNEYKTSSNIYVVVDKGGSVQALTVGTNANLYLVTNNTGSGTEQLITEESVANALKNGVATDEGSTGSNNTWTVTGAGMKSLIVTTVSVPTLTAVSSIAEDDSPTGVAITVNGAKFTPVSAGYYVFEYIKASQGAVYTQATGTYVSGTTYYTDNTGATEVDTSGFTEGTTDVSSYYVLTTPASAEAKYYKVIKVE